MRLNKRARDTRPTPGQRGGAWVKLYWRHVEVYFGVNDVRYAIRHSNVQVKRFADAIRASQTRVTAAQRALSTQAH